MANPCLTQINYQIKNQEKGGSYVERKKKVMEKKQLKNNNEKKQKKGGSQTIPQLSKKEQESKKHLRKLQISAVVKGALEIENSYGKRFFNKPKASLFWCGAHYATGDPFFFICSIRQYSAIEAYNELNKFN